MTPMEGRTGEEIPQTFSPFTLSSPVVFSIGWTQPEARRQRSLDDAGHRIQTPVAQMGLGRWRMDWLGVAGGEGGKEHR